MSSKPFTSYIDDTEIKLQDNITVDWDIYTMATFNAAIVKANALNGFDPISIKRDEIEIFGGRVETSSPVFSSGGRYMAITGFDNTVRLRDYKTAIRTIVASTTADALADILSETPFDIETDGVFEYITALDSWETWIDFCVDLDNIVSGGVELDLDSTVEISQEVAAGTYTLCNVGLKTNFMYDGAQHRLYIFARDSTNAIYYFHSIDGVTWASVNTGFNSQSNAFSVGWSGSAVYLFLDDGTNTDFLRGTIASATGVITWVASIGNIFADTVRFGPVFDDDFHVWVIRDNAGGEAWESADDGATWNNIFGPGANELWAIGQVGSDGDMTGITLDTVASDLEEWTWDRSAASFTFTAKIMNEDDVDGMDLCQDLVHNIYFAYHDGTDLFYGSNQSGGWADDTIAFASLNTYSVGCEGRNMYLYTSSNLGVQLRKIYNVTILDTWTNADGAVSTPSFISCPRGYLQDGQFAIFCATIDGGDDVYVIIHSPVGIRIGEGSTTARFVTQNIVASVAFTSWGLLTADGVGISNGVDVLWDIQTGGGVDLVTDQTAAFDINLAGVDPVETTIQINCVLDDNGTDPYVYSFDITERTDNLNIETDGEDAYTGVSKLAELAGAEFWVEDDGDGTYTVYFSTRRGEDKSGWIILKCATTSDEPDTKANIKVLSPTYDWTDFANAVLFIGGLDTGGDRVSAEVQDNESIASRGQEFWITVRDAEVTTTSMARQRAVLELNKRNSVTIRIRGEFVDKLSSNSIKIGDSVTLIGEWHDADLKVDGSYRIVALNRTWGVGGGEQVTAEFTNRMKPAQYYNYLQKVDSLERVSTQ